MPPRNVVDWCFVIFINQFRKGTIYKVLDDRCRMNYNKMKYCQSISLQSRCHSGHKNNKLGADDMTDIWRYPGEKVCV